MSGVLEHVVQRAAFAGVIQAFYGAFSASDKGKDARKDIGRGRRHEAALQSRKIPVSGPAARLLAPTEVGAWGDHGRPTLPAHLLRRYWLIFAVETIV